MYTGTSADQDSRFADKEKKLMKAMKFDAALSTKVDMEKVNLDTIKPWVTKKITELLGVEDEVLIQYIFEMLESERHPDPKQMQISITGFLNGRNARLFMAELWALLTSAQTNIGGIPTPFLEKKKEEIRLRKLEQDRLQANRMSSVDFSEERMETKDIKPDPDIKIMTPAEIAVVKAQALSKVKEEVATPKIGRGAVAQQVIDPFTTPPKAIWKTLSGYLTSPSTTPQGRDAKPGWYTDHNKFVEISKTSASGVLLIGDSIISGLTRYPKIWQKYFQQLNALNFGIGGDRVQHVLWRVENGEIPLNLQMVVIHVGTNNLDKDVPNEIFEGICCVVNCFQASKPNAKIIVSGILPRDLEWSDRRIMIDRVNKKLHKWCRSPRTRNVWFLKHDSDWTLPDGRLNEKYFYTDYVHLIEAGDEKFANAIHTKIMKVLQGHYVPSSESESEDDKENQVYMKERGKDGPTDKGKKDRSYSRSRSRSPRGRRSRSRSRGSRRGSYTRSRRSRSLSHSRSRRRKYHSRSRSPRRRSPRRRSPYRSRTPTRRRSRSRSRSRSVTKSPRRQRRPHHESGRRSKRHHSKSSSRASSESPVRSKVVNANGDTRKEQSLSVSPPPSHRKSGHRGSKQEDEARDDTEAKEKLEGSEKLSSGSEREDDIDVSKDKPREASPTYKKSDKTQSRRYRTKRSRSASSSSPSPEPEVDESKVSRKPLRGENRQSKEDFDRRSPPRGKDRSVTPRVDRKDFGQSRYQQRWSQGRYQRRSFSMSPPRRRHVSPDHRRPVQRSGQPYQPRRRSPTFSVSPLRDQRRHNEDRRRQRSPSPRRGRGHVQAQRYRSPERSRDGHWGQRPKRMRGRSEEFSISPEKQIRKRARKDSEEEAASDSSPEKQKRTKDVQRKRDERKSSKGKKREKTPSSDELTEESDSDNEQGDRRVVVKKSTEGADRASKKKRKQGSPESDENQSDASEEESADNSDEESAEESGKGKGKGKKSKAREEASSEEESDSENEKKVKKRMAYKERLSEEKLRRSKKHRYEKEKAARLKRQEEMRESKGRARGQSDRFDRVEQRLKIARQRARAKEEAAMGRMGKRRRQAQSDSDDHERRDKRKVGRVPDRREQHDLRRVINKRTESRRKVSPTVRRRLSPVRSKREKYGRREAGRDRSVSPQRRHKKQKPRKVSVSPERKRKQQSEASSSEEDDSESDAAPTKDVRRVVKEKAKHRRDSTSVSESEEEDEDDVEEEEDEEEEETAPVKHARHASPSSDSEVEKSGGKRQASDDSEEELEEKASSEEEEDEEEDKDRKKKKHKKHRKHNKKEKKHKHKKHKDRRKAEQSEDEEDESEQAESDEERSDLEMKLREKALMSMQKHRKRRSGSSSD